MTNPKVNATLSPAEYDALTRLDFWIFVQRVFLELEGCLLLDNWHIQKLCAELERVRTEAATRLAIALPPRSLKSIIGSIALAAWLLGHDPTCKVICVSYAQEFADQLAADCRRVMLSPWYRRLFPRTRLQRQAVGDLVTTEGGKRYATSIEGTITGMGAGVIIVDDPMKPGEAMSDVQREKINAWLSHTLFTRLNNKLVDRLVVIMQRLHEDDMIGRLTRNSRFELLSFSAIAQADETIVIKTPFGTIEHQRKEGEALHHEREPLEVLIALRDEMGPTQFATQYLGEPSPPGGGLIKSSWFLRYNSAEPLPRFTRIIQSWDCAFKVKEANDHSVCTTWGITPDRQCYLLHVFRGKLEFPALKRKVRELADQHRAGFVLIEDAASGIPLIQEIASEGFARIVPFKVRGDKVVRMKAVTPKMETGKVWIPAQAHWLTNYLHELEMFPNGRHDDQVDSTSQALAYVGEPVPGQGVLDWIAAEMGDENGPSDDRTVTYDYCIPNVVIGPDSGRGADGFFHTTPEHWNTINGIYGMRLIHTEDRDKDRVWGAQWRLKG